MAELSREGYKHICNLFRNMNYLDDLISDYYERVGIERNDSARDHQSTMARQAIMVSLCTLSSMTAIGNKFGKDHTTILYAKRKHDRNMRNLDYIDLYNTATEVVEDLVGKVDNDVFSDTNKAKEFIFALVRENNYLRSELHREIV